MLLMALILIVPEPFDTTCTVADGVYSQTVSNLGNSMIINGGIHWISGETLYRAVQLRTPRNSCKNWQVYHRPVSQEQEKS